MRKLLGMVICFSALNLCAFAEESKAEKELTIADISPEFVEQVAFQSPSERDMKWKTEIYDKIPGKTHEEKNYNALSNWDMKAVAEIELWQK